VSIHFGLCPPPAVDTNCSLVAKHFAATYFLLIHSSTPIDCVVSNLFLPRGTGESSLLIVLPLRKLEEMFHHICRILT